jgi:hypothetical protein
LSKNFSSNKNERCKTFNDICTEYGNLFECNKHLITHFPKVDGKVDNVYSFIKGLFKMLEVIIPKNSAEFKNVIEHSMEGMNGISRKVRDNPGFSMDFPLDHEEQMTLFNCLIPVNSW